MNEVYASTSFLSSSGGYLHNFCGLGRALQISQQLYPQQDVLSNLLSTFCSETSTSSESDLTVMKERCIVQLGKIHPNALEQQDYKEIKSADSCDKIRLLAKKCFNQTKRVATRLAATPDAARADEIKAALGQLWASILQENNFERAKETIQTQLQAINMPGITSAYLEAIALAKDMDALKKRVRSYQNDLKIKEIGNAVQSTSHGISGYPKIITWQRGKESREGFMKHFTLPEELEQHRLYEFLLGQSGEHPFRTAAAAMISPFDTSPYHITPQGERKDLSEAQSKLLQSLTIFIASAYHSCNEGLSVKNKFLTHVKERPVAFFERINGVGLLDYLKTNYAQLSKDKKDTLIEHLGMITFLDFVLGHQDRMLPIDNQAFSPLLDPLNILESNLGNLMLTPDGETIFAIDNGLRPGVDVVSTQELRESALPSLEVLKETLQDNKVHENLAVALSKALELPIEEEDDDTGNLATLKGDLTQDSFKTSLIQGMQKMEQMLIKKLIPKWEEGKFNLSLSQELTATIDSRLLAFTEAAQTRNREEQIPGMV